MLAGSRARRRTLGKKSASPALPLVHALLLVFGIVFSVALLCYCSIGIRLLQQRNQYQPRGRNIRRDVPSGRTTNGSSGSSAHATSTDILSSVHGARSGIRKPKATIAYLTSITACPSEDIRNFVDAGAVLKHSIHLNSIRNPNSHSAYDYAMYAIIHTDASDCAEHFEKIGYNVLLRNTPFNLSEIRSPDYLKRLTNPNAGCCQEKEFLKLYSYTMHEYAVVVHLDMDFVLLKPIDHIFDAFFLPDDETKEISDAMWPAHQTWTGRIETMFTRDYPMGHPGRESVKVGMQGGFWIVRPNQTAFDELIGLIRQGHFSAGWYDGDVHYPGFYGAAMIQGLIAFYYGHYHPNQAVELQRCIHNQMADNPTSSNGKCFVNVDGECRDCRAEKVDDIYSAHFTFCGKPWKCIDESYFGKNKAGRARLCLDFHERWHATRHDLENQLGKDMPFDENDRSYGHCVKRLYSPMDLES